MTMPSQPEKPPHQPAHGPLNSTSESPDSLRKPVSPDTTTTNIKDTTDPIPRIPITLRNHKLLLLLHWLPLLLTSCLLPEIGYFTLRYTTHLKLQYILSIFTPLFGVVSLTAFVLRTIRLTSSSASYRPLGCEYGSKWTLDYFQYNFALGFCVVCAIIAAGIAQNPSNVRMASLPLPLLLIQVCGQMLLLYPLRHLLSWRIPCRISSLPRGEKARPAVYTIVEDIVAVDAKQGTAFRSVWQERWNASPEFQKLLDRMDLLWGVTGTGVAVGCIAVIFGVSEESVGWGVGWAVPWLWASLMAVISVQMTKRACRRENAWAAAQAGAA